MAANAMESSTRTARVRHPVDFQIYDDGNAAALYIDDGSPARSLHLALHNQSGADIELAAATGPSASSENHHLELRFRPGILSQHALGILRNPQASKKVLPHEWDVRASAATPGAPVSLYLLYRGARLFANDERRVLSFCELSAGAAQGARPTQVEVKLRGWRYKGADHPIDSTFHRHLNVLHWGRSDVPLRVVFPGTCVLVNDGSENTPKLRVVNIGDQVITASPLGGEQPSFVLSFDVGGSEQWWSIRPEEAKGIRARVKWPSSEADMIDETAGGAVPRWSANLPKTGLAPGQYFDIDITGLKTRGTGTTNLYLAYRNIPRYRDGRFVCPMIRAPWNEQMLAASLVDHANKLEGHEITLVRRARDVARLNSTTESHSSQLAELTSKLDKLAKALEALKATPAPPLMLHWVQSQITSLGTHAYTSMSVQKGDIVEAIVDFSAIGRFHFGIECQGVPVDRLTNGHGTFNSNNPGWMPASVSGLFRAHESGPLTLCVGFGTSDVASDIKVAGLQLTAKVLPNTY